MGGTRVTRPIPTASARPVSRAVIAACLALAVVLAGFSAAAAQATRAAATGTRRTASLASDAPAPSLVAAVKAGNHAVVRELIERRADVNAPQADGTTALHWAVDRDDAEIVRMLVRAGAAVKIANRYGATPLWLAAVNGSATTLGILLEAGADANTASADGETVLMVAARTGQLDAVKVLLARGADPNVKERWRGQTALMWAAAEGHAAVIPALAERGADLHVRSNGGFTALLFAAREGRIAAVEALLQGGARLDDALPVRARGNAQRPADAPPEVGLDAFLLAAANAHYELAARLLDRGADPNAAPQGYTALHQVSWVRKAGIAGSNNPAPEGSGTMDSLTFVRRLVAKGAAVNARVTKRPQMGVTTLNSIGATPFMLAARTADAQLMRLLADLGGDPLAPNADGSTPLMVAAGLGTNAPGEDPGTEPEVLDAVRLALALGNDINAVDSNGETAMHGAAYKHVPSVVRYLAQQGARRDVWDRPNKSGWTPLRIADGVHRGMNIVSSPPTAAVIRDVMAEVGAH
jgi:ankyrin repeat protein